jgi:hypothetical protein
MPHFNYYDDWKNADVQCEKCVWRGSGADLVEGEITDDLIELRCPSCHDCTALLIFPTLAESRENWHKLSESERLHIEKIEAFQANFENRKLNSTTELPDIPDPAFVLNWDMDDEGTLIRQGERVIFREPAIWEGYERFEKVAEILRARYGPALRDLVPTGASEMYLYGDRLASPGIVDAARKRIFSDGDPGASQSASGSFS